MSGRVSELITYPIKGCAGTSLPAAELTFAGLAHDRSFMVINEDGGFRTQRRDPLLSIVRPAIADGGKRLTLHAPQLEPLSITVDSRGPCRDVELFGTPFTGIDQGDAVAQWFSQHLRQACRLVRVPPDHQRVSDGQIPGTSGYADSCAVLMVARSSLQRLNDRLRARGADPLPMNRFRPNIVVDGWDEPHLEDRIRRATIADAELGYAKLAVRCAVTMVDQERGCKAGPEPIRTLADYRRARDGGVAFGSKFAVLRTGILSLGDVIVVGQEDESELS